jgi:hypothetical protein
MCGSCREQVERGAAVRRSITGLVRGQRHSSPQICSYEQRINDTSSSSGVCEPLVSAGCDLRQRECCAAEDPGHAGDLLYVRDCVAAHPFGVAAVHGIDLISPDLLAIGFSDPQAPRDCLEAVVR